MSVALSDPATMKLADNEAEEPPLSDLAPVAEDEDLDKSDSEDIEATKVAQAQQQRHARERDVFNKHLQATADKSSKDAFDHSFTSKTSENSKPIIDNPRDYQNELFERAKRDNVIAVLDTGSGKTLIAALLMRHTATQELQDRAEGRPPRISFFLVNSVHLVNQQQKMLKKNLPESFRPAALHGGTNVDLWKLAEWQKLKQDYRAVVCTAEVLNQSLMHSFVKINEINLLIFDEAHHTKKGHPFARIIKDYYLAENDHERRPKIFGMTASPVNCNTDIDKAA